VALLLHSVVGRGLVRDIHRAAAQGLLAPNVRVVPGDVTVMAQLVQHTWLGCVSGLDMSALNNAQWYPGVQPIPRHRCAHKAHVIIP
jgi:hypothetical protein